MFASLSTLLRPSLGLPIRIRKPQFKRIHLRRALLTVVAIYALVWAPTILKIDVSKYATTSFLYQDIDPCSDCFNYDTSVPCSVAMGGDPWCQRYLWTLRDVPASRNLSIPASKDALIFDLNCRHKYRYDYYHYLFDCSVPIMPVLGLMQRLEKLQPPSLFIAIHNRPLHEVISTIFSSSLTRPVVHMNSRTPTKDTVKYENRETVTMMPSELKPLFVHRNPAMYAKCSPCFRSQAHKAFGVNITPVRNSDRILVLWREASRHGINAGGRAILDHDYLVNELVGKFGDRVTVHYGNESLAETVNLFGTSSVMIGYHGAGMVNSLFMRKGSLVIEITTFTEHPDTQELKVWRANIPNVHYGLGIDYSLHLVEHHHLDPEVPSEISDWDHALKPLNVILGREHVYQVLEKTERFLAKLDGSKLA